MDDVYSHHNEFQAAERYCQPPRWAWLVIQTEFCGDKSLRPACVSVIPSSVVCSLPPSSLCHHLVPPSAKWSGLLSHPHKLDSQSEAKSDLLFRQRSLFFLNSLFFFLKDILIPTPVKGTVTEPCYGATEFCYVLRQIVEIQSVEGCAKGFFHFLILFF